MRLTPVRNLSVLSEVIRPNKMNTEMMQLKYLEVLQLAADGMGNTFVLSGVDELQKSIVTK